jgi:hypothetical protein
MTRVSRFFTVRTVALCLLASAPVSLLAQRAYAAVCGCGDECGCGAGCHCNHG